MSSRLSRLGDLLLDWLAPSDCLGCSTETGSNHGWCGACAAELESNPVTELNDRVLLAPYRHAGPVRHAIHHLKYAGRPDYARRLVLTAFCEQRPAIVDGATLIPVPLHPIRLIERGYNQAALLARALARRWRLAIAFGLLLRTASTGFQVGRDRAERSENVHGAFLVQRSRMTLGNAWLVDDVVTTGATANSCRLALEAAGIQVAGIIALSHAASPCPAKKAIIVAST